jgi:H+/Cl- antiporter ClcA/CBS domain-containing protein
MPSHETERGSTTEGLAISPSLGPALAQAQVPPHSTIVDRRTLFLSLISIGVAVAAAFVAQALVHLIGLFTNIAFYGRFSATFVSPADNHLGYWVIGVPVIGGVIVGIMARYGSKAIRGHGIPEAMEQVLTNQSRIPPRMTFLKPLSAAIAIGTGGPFGAEGPIIATGGALGSLIGQLLHTTATERKILLSAGAAAGMAATFGSPVSAVILAIELLLFEYRPRSMIPVALAASTAAGVRVMFEGTAPVFAMPDLATPSGGALAIYVLIGALTGLAAVAVTRAVYFVEDAFEHIPIHWMWWPAIGAVVVGVVGYFAPKTLGVGYSNITDIISNHWTIKTVAVLCAMKFVSWCFSLGSGTSGGTLAPLFTIGGGLGAILGYQISHLLPAAQVDLRVAALVGMAAMFAGASRAVLASAVFAFETTLQPLGLLPLLGGCTASYLVSCLLMRNSIMTEKIARRGVRVPMEYAADSLDRVVVADVASKSVVTLKASDSIAAAREFLNSSAVGSRHQGFPALDEKGFLAGIVTRKDLLDPSASGQTVRDLIKRPPVIVYADCSLREAADHMVNHDIGRLPVFERENPTRLFGIITRSDVLAGFRHRIRESARAEQSIEVSTLWGKLRNSNAQ